MAFRPPDQHHNPSVPTRLAEFRPFPHCGLQAANCEFESLAHETELREQLTPHGRSYVPYRCNRAVIFRSDQWHESEPYTFEGGYTEVRFVRLRAASAVGAQSVACTSAKHCASVF